MSFIHQVIDNSRLLNVLYDNLDKEITLNPNYQKLCAYLSGYLEFNKVSVDQATEVYTRFISSYNKDCRQFIKTNRYPYELNPEIVKISREDYDIILLFSVLFSPHRFRIMELIHENKGAGKALYIGLGPGLELLFTNSDYSKKIAYDLAVNLFLNKEFNEVDWKALEQALSRRLNGFQLWLSKQAIRMCATQKNTARIQDILNDCCPSCGK
jgi:hypothetical protein